MPILSSTKTVQDLATAVKRQFGDESGAQIQDTDIIRWVNEGQLELANQTKYTKTTTTTNTVVGQDQYTLPGVNIIGIDSVYFNNTPLQQRSKLEFEELVLRTVDPASGIQNGTPILWYEYDDSIFLYPPPDSVKTLKLFASVLPTAVVNLSDTLSIPDTQYKTLLNWVLSQAYELDDDLPSANYKEKQVAAMITDFKDDVSERSYPVITVLPEDQ